MDIVCVIIVSIALAWALCGISYAIAQHIREERFKRYMQEVVNDPDRRRAAMQDIAKQTSDPWAKAGESNE